MPRKSIRERFLDKVSPEPNTGCWFWIGACNSWGYGNFWRSGKLRKAHRAAYRLFVGPIPEGLWVLHSCDQPPCVNPDHLFVGTHQDNMDDCARKGRGLWNGGLCIRGHERKETTSGRVYCPTCHLKLKRRHRAEQRSAYGRNLW